MGHLTRLLVATFVVIGMTAAPAAAQAPPSPITVTTSLHFPGGTVHAEGTCAQATGTFEVRLTGDGGSHAVTIAAGSPTWGTDLLVPWSMADGPATVTSTCSTPPQTPAAVTVERRLPVAPTDVTVTPGNGSVFVDARFVPGDWFLTAAARRVDDGTVVSIGSWPTGSGGASIAAPNGVPVEVVVWATNAQGAGPAAAPVGATASSERPPATVPPAPSIDSLLATQSGGLRAIWHAPATDGGSQIFGWSIAVARAGSSEVLQSRFVRSDQLATSITSLDAGTYDVYVAGVSAVGYGAPAVRSVRVFAATEPAGRPFVPFATSLQHDGDRLVVNWLPVPLDFGSPVVAYAVVVVQGGEVVAWRNVDANTRRVAFPDLGIPQPPTTVHVLGISTAGFGPPTTLYTGG